MFSDKGKVSCKVLRDSEIKIRNINYHIDVKWTSSIDQATYQSMRWKNRIFVFLGGLNEDFDGVHSHILNIGNLSNIVEVYFQVKGKKHKIVMVGKGVETKKVRIVLGMGRR